MDKRKDKKVSKPISAIVIIASAIAFPLYFLFEQNLSLPTAEQWVLISLYSLAVIGLTLLALGVKIKDITSEETDKRIKQNKAAFDKALKPYSFVVLIAIMIWLITVIVELNNNA